MKKSLNPHMAIRPVEFHPRMSICQAATIRLAQIRLTGIRDWLGIPWRTYRGMRPNMRKSLKQLEASAKQLRSEIAASSGLAVHSRTPILSALDRLVDAIASDPARSHPGADGKHGHILEATKALAIASVNARLAAGNISDRNTMGEKLDHLLDEAFALAAKLIKLEN